MNVLSTLLADVAVAGLTCSWTFLATVRWAYLNDPAKPRRHP